MRTALAFGTLVGLLALSVSTAAQDAGPGRRYLPYGVPVPVGQTPDGEPEPYDSARHGPAVRNTQPEANLVGRPGARPVEGDRRRVPPPLPMLAGGDDGYILANNIGMYAANDAQTDLVIPTTVDDAVIYAPTHMPGSFSCLETTTMHMKYKGWTSTTHEHGFYDHCVKFEFVVREPMNSTWMDKYARVYDGEPRYYTMAYKAPDNCWYGYLYNYLLGQWENKTGAIGCGLRGGQQNGWTMWESWYMMPAGHCPTLPSIRSSSIQVRTTSGTWTPLTSTYVLGRVSQLSTNCWQKGIYNFHLHSVTPHYDEWHAHTPNP